MNLWDKCLNWAEKTFCTARIFKRVFDLNQNDTLIILGNLQEFCGVDNLNLRLDKNGDIPPYDLARRAGRLEVYQHIAKYLSMTE
ncbi:MAG: hypothetical protein EBU90_24900, partial [Proteobacteria bacterium]|nr:hypothetical protein [Pseudomonadota bacterium]